MEPAQQPQLGSRETPAPRIGKGERPSHSGQAAPGIESGPGIGGSSPLEGGKGTAAVAGAARTGLVGGHHRRRKRGAAATGCGASLALAANGTQAAAAAIPGNGANSLLLRRGRLKRNLSAASSPAAPIAAAAALGTRSLDRKTLLLLPKPPRQLQPLQAPERDWVRRDLQRGCVHVYYYYPQQQQQRGSGGGGCSLLPVLCNLETTAAEVALRLLQLGHRGGGSSAVRVWGKAAAAAEAPLPHKEEAAADVLLLQPATASLGGKEEALPEPAEAPTSPAGSLTPIPVGRRPRSRRGAPNGLGAGEAAAVRPRRLALSGGESGRASGQPSLSPSDCSPGRAFPPPRTELYLSGPPLSCPSLLGGSDTESFSPSAESASDRLDPYSGGGALLRRLRKNRKRILRRHPRPRKKETDRGLEGTSHAGQATRFRCMARNPGWAGEPRGTPRARGKLCGEVPLLLGKPPLRSSLRPCMSSSMERLPAGWNRTRSPCRFKTTTSRSWASGTCGGCRRRAWTRRPVASSVSMQVGEK
ncbi:hypothetical protein E2320_011039 [Naja naja]|nr:hypothetical protein E2320_011039 [Naja naja]